MALALQAQRAARTFVRLDPSSVATLDDLGLDLALVGDAQWARGHLDEAVNGYRKARGAWSNLSKDYSFFLLVRGAVGRQLGYMQAISGDLSGALSTATSDQRLVRLLPGRDSPDSPEALVVELGPQAVRAEVAYERDDFTGASQIAYRSIGRLRNAKPLLTSEKLQGAMLLYAFSSIYGHAEYCLHHFARAESTERLALAQRRIFWTGETLDKRDMAESSTWLAMALARQGKTGEAEQVIAPVVKFDEQLLARDHGDVWVPYELAGALYAESLAEPARREMLLRRAAALLRSLPRGLQRLHDVQQWRRRVLQSLPASAAILP